MPFRHIPRNRLGLSALLAGSVCECAAALPFLASGSFWFDPRLALVLHTVSAIFTGTGAASLLTGRQFPRQSFGPAALFMLLAATIPVAGVVAVLVLTTILLTHRIQLQPPKPALVHIPEPASLFSAPSTTAPLVSLIPDLDTTRLRQSVLAMADLPADRTRPLLRRLRNHPDRYVRIYAAGLINDQTTADEQRLATLEDRCRNAPRDLPTLLDVVEAYLRLFDACLVPADLLAHTAQQAIHAAGAVLALAPHHTDALQSMALFQMITCDFHGAYATILRLHQIAGQKAAATELLARLSFEYAARQPVASTSPPFPPHSKVQARLP